jgi:hypothetical protein
MTERTTIVINGGPGIQALGQAVALARSLQPAMVVVEELTRRAVLLAAVESGDPSAAPRVGSRHLTQALAALDGATDPIRRSLLGARPAPRAGRRARRRRGRHPPAGRAG